MRKFLKPRLKSTHEENEASNRGGSNIAAKVAEKHQIVSSKVVNLADIILNTTKGLSV